jgi:hypothetical protein
VPEFNLAISSWKSTASSLDNISPIMLKHLLSNALAYLLSIMNNILTSSQVLPSWISYRVFPIPKPNSNDSFCPIAFSSSLCKVFEYMLKTRLDRWLESNSVLPANLFAFRKGLGTMEYHSTFIGNIYHSVVSPRLGVFYNQHLINQYLIIKNNLLRILVNSPRSS